MPGFKLLTYFDQALPKAGVAIGDRAFEAADLLRGSGVADTATTFGILQDWDLANAALSRHASSPPVGGMPLDSLKLAAPILYPGAYFCAAANYYQHSREMGGPDRVVTREGKQPYFFLKPPRHTTVGPDEPVAIPRVTRKLDWELELAVVIGRTATNLTVENAFSCVAGFTMVNDLSARDLSKRDDWQFVSDWFGQKVFDSSMPMGPWIVPAADVPDPQNLTLKLWLNDELQQNSTTGDMIFNIAEQIEYVSRRLTLRPGDVIATGTPSGVGAPRGLFLKSGDVIRMEIESIGSMRTPIA